MLINVQCLLCKEVLVVEEDDTRKLIDHVQGEHPSLQLTYCRKNSKKMEKQEPMASSSDQSVEKVLKETSLDGKPIDKIPANENLAEPVVSNSSRASRHVKKYEVKAEFKPSGRRGKYYVTTSV